MVVSPEVVRKTFAAFIGRALREARANGETDRSITDKTGIPAQTFHRWRRGEGGLPQLDKVYAFCDGLGIPRRAAVAALGMSDQPVATPPEDIPADLLALARKLRDPNVPDAEKYLIRETVRSLAARRTRREDAG